MLASKRKQRWNAAGVLAECWRSAAGVLAECCWSAGELCENDVFGWGSSQLMDEMGMPALCLPSLCDRLPFRSIVCVISLRIRYIRQVAAHTKPTTTPCLQAVRTDVDDLIPMEGPKTETGERFGAASQST